MTFALTHTHTNTPKRFFFSVFFHGIVASHGASPLLLSSSTPTRVELRSPLATETVHAACVLKTARTQVGAITLAFGNTVYSFLLSLLLSLLSFLRFLSLFLTVL
jgi:hypothetical protein